MSPRAQSRGHYQNNYSEVIGLDGARPDKKCKTTIESTMSPRAQSRGSY